MRPGNASDIQIAGFGFVDYFIDGSLQRLPVQFIRCGQATWARLGQLRHAPSYIRVTATMRAETMGDMGKVTQRYESELQAVLADAKSWTRCLFSSSSSLTLFRALHGIRMRGLSVADAVSAAEQLVVNLDQSEYAAIQGIATFYANELVHA